MYPESRQDTLKAAPELIVLRFLELVKPHGLTEVGNFPELGQDAGGDTEALL